MAGYITRFNRDDHELYPQFIPNAAAFAFLRTNAPLFECPDPDLERTYYFRWWTFRKHLKQTPDGFVVTEFLPPVPWAGKYNTISCAAGHHLREGRWLADPRYLDDYSRFWFGKDARPRTYSFWAADALWNRYLVTGDSALMKTLLPDLVRNYEGWEKDRLDPSGLYWQEDGQDGMEVSISGSGCRATLNSYQYGDALAIARIARMLGQTSLASNFQQKAETLKRLVQERLWDSAAGFFKVRPRGPNAGLSDARELHGFTPWYFNLPDLDKSVAWKQLMDPQGFYAPCGLTTAERRHPGFALSSQGHECQWNGPSWPYATSVTLTALANLLNSYQQDLVTPADYVRLLTIYAKAHQLQRPDSSTVPWIDENLNPLTGDWIARTRLKSWKNNTWDTDKGGEERGKDYNHSTFCDLVINGLVGLRPRADETVEIHPLAPASWPYFCLDRVPYHGRRLTIFWDQSGTRYGRGKGFHLLVNGVALTKSELLGPIQATLPSGIAASSPSPSSSSSSRPAETAGGWVKAAENPIMGGKYGTCFDISVLKESSTYRMWLSWRPKKSLALVESPDGVHWSEPPRIVVGPNPETGWEDDINRPVVLKRQDGYHLWYTGQSNGRSAIGYATSEDGISWKRMSSKPVLAPEARWEKGAVMCPHVLWDAQTNLFRMWYSAGDQYEPDAIGYASSPDGIHWNRHPGNPVFRPDPTAAWEQHKVTACQVIKTGDWHVMFYIGFRDVDHAQIGVARSRDGLTGWQRHPQNPIIRAGQDQWDQDACYKPYAIFDGTRWLLWYNGRRGSLEQIGVVLHPGEDLGF